jgi:hypothetical protein
MKDIIKEMRDCAKCLRDTPAFSDIPDHVVKAMDRWASRLEAMHPADVPSAEELADVVSNAFGDFAGDWDDIANAILSHLSPWLQPRTVTAEQVVALAKALHKSHENYFCRNGIFVVPFENHASLWRCLAFAAFAAAGFNVEEWK